LYLNQKKRLTTYLVLNFSIEKLIEKLRLGDRLSQKLLYDSYAPKLFVVCKRYGKTTAEAEDLLQEAFLQIFQGIVSFQQKSDLYTWMYRITINTAIRAFQKEKKHDWGPEIGEKEIASTETALDHLALEELLELIGKLPKGCQTIFNLYALDGYSHQEIAQALTISVGTSKSQYARAKMLLQESIKKQNRYYETK
jgi:RNA polymerase sigma factor (sigma-70 family)